MTWHAMSRAVSAALAPAVTAALLTGCAADRAHWQDGRLRAPPSADDTANGRSAPVADPVYPRYGNPGVDVLHYDLELAWSPHKRELTGKAAITLRAVTQIDEVSLDFSDALKVTKTTVNGVSAQVRRQGGDLVTPLATPVEPDSELTLTVMYSGTPKPAPMPSTRSDFSEGIGLRVEPDGAIWTMQEPYGAFTWYPVNDQPSDEALYDFTITVPEGWSAVASGEHLGVDTANGRSVFRWRSSAPAGSYVTTIAVDRLTRHRDAWGDVPLTYWTPEEHDDHQLAAMRRSPRILGWLQQRFGDYPFSSGGAVAVDSASAMETQAMVTMGGLIGSGLSSAQAKQVFTEVLVHEYAHQWFGNAVSPRDWRAVWLNEGFATYATMLWLIDHDLADEQQHIRELRKRDTAARAHSGPPGDYNPRMFAESNVYVGPALMLHEIRDEIGDEKFFALCRDWAQQHLNTNQDRESFTRFVNAHSGRDLTPIIDKWLDSTTTPT